VPLSDLADRWIAAASRPDGVLAPGFGVPLAVVGCVAAGFLGTAFTACDPDEAVGRGATTGAIAGTVGALGALLAAATVAASTPILHVAAAGASGTDVLVDQLADGLGLLALAQLALVLLGALGGALAGGLGGAAAAATGACERGTPAHRVSDWSFGAAAVLVSPLAIATVPAVGVSLVMLVQAMSRNATESGRLLSSFDTVAVLAWAAANVLLGVGVLRVAGRAIRSAWRARDVPQVRVAAGVVLLVSSILVAATSDHVSHRAHEVAGADVSGAALAVGTFVAQLAALTVSALLAFRVRPAASPSPWVAAETALLIGPLAHALVVPTLVYGLGAALGMVAAIPSLAGQGTLAPDAIDQLVDVTVAAHDGVWPLQAVVPLIALAVVQPALWLGGRLLARRRPRPA
jgi:hypothetical protein